MAHDAGAYYFRVKRAVVGGIWAIEAVADIGRRPPERDAVRRPGGGAAALRGDGGASFGELG